MQKSIGQRMLVNSSSDKLGLAHDWKILKSNGETIKDVFHVYKKSIYN